MTEQTIPEKPPEVIPSGTVAPEPMTFQERLAQSRELRKRKQHNMEVLRKQFEVQQEMHSTDPEKGWLANTFGSQGDDKDEGFFGFVDDLFELSTSALEDTLEGIPRAINAMGEPDWTDDSLLSINSQLVLLDKDIIGEAGISVPFTNKQLAFVSAKRLDEANALMEIATGERVANLGDFEVFNADRPDSKAGEMTVALIKWMSVFMATRTALGGAATTGTGTIALGMGAGAITDAVAFDPHEERLSNLLTEWGKDNPVFDNALTQYLAADSDDGGLEGALKNVIEGMGIGIATEMLFTAAKTLRAWRIRKRFDETKSSDFEIVDDLAEEVADDAAEAAAKQGDEATEGAARQTDEAQPQGLDDAVEAAQRDIADVDIGEQVRSSFKLKANLKPEQIKTLADAAMRGDYAKASGSYLFNYQTIDWDAMAEGDNLQKFFYAMEDVAKKMLGEAQASPQTFAQTKAIAEAVGYTGENAERLFGTLKGNGGITARMFAAHQAMVGSSRQALKLARLAKKTGSNQDLFNLHRHIEMHAALMAMVKGSESEIGRALGAMRMMRDAAAESYREFAEIKQVMGGHKNTNAVIDSILDAGDSNSLLKINSAVARTTGRKLSNIITEVAINGLLSSGKTHVVNFASNGIMMILSPLERYIAAGVSIFTRTNSRVALQEAHAQVGGMMRSVTLAMRLAFQAAKEGRPISDIRQRVEFDSRKAIHSRGRWTHYDELEPAPAKFNDLRDNNTTFLPRRQEAVRDTQGNIQAVVNRNAMQRGIGLLGNTVRIPGRALLAGDEFFKTIHKEGEYAALSYRAAAKKADLRKFKTPQGRADFIKMEFRRTLNKADRDPKLQAQAIRAARRATFQENAQTSFGPHVERLLSFHPLFKLAIAPFVRTPMNLLRQSFVDRNPALFWVVKKNQELMRNGGPEADLMYARLISGTALFTGGLILAENGVIQGRGENYNNTQKMDKTGNYSMEVADGHWTFDRLDPLGSIFGLAADTHYALKYGYDPMDPESDNLLQELSQAVGIGFMQNALNKTWMRSIADVMESATKITEGSGPTSTRALQSLTASNLQKFIPFSSGLRSYTQSIDPVIREAWTVRDRVFRNLPGLSDDLPPIRDMLGRPVTRENAEWYWINPFGGNPASDNPVDRELSRLSFDMGILEKEVEGVQIDSRQFSELKRLIGNTGSGPTFEQELAAAFETDGYKNLPTDKRRIKYIKQRLESRKKIAKRLLLQQDTELRKATQLQEIREYEQLNGVDLQNMKDKLGLE